MADTKTQPKVLLFSTPQCSWCTKAKSYFRQNKVRFKDIDVSRDPRAAKDMQRKTGQMGVPVIMIGSHRPIVGFDKRTIDRLLELSA